MPKHMVFGPCENVHGGGACEVAEDPCVFLDRVPVAWPEAAERGGQLPGWWWTAAVAAAVELSERMLEVTGIAGVNLSGGPGDGGEHRFAVLVARRPDDRTSSRAGHPGR